MKLDNSLRVVYIIFLMLYLFQNEKLRLSWITY